MNAAADRVRIGLLSDTHVPEAAPELPPEVYAALAGCDRILHGGDLHVLDVVDQLERLAPTLASRGNGDTPHPVGGRPGVPDDPRVADTFVIDVNGIRVGLTHDLEHAEGRSDEDVRQILHERFGVRVDIAVCGHTHVPMVWGLDDGTAIVNPGSPTLPYGYRDVLGTIGLIEIDGPSFEISVLDLASATTQLRLAGPAEHPCVRGPRPRGGR